MKGQSFGNHLQEQIVAISKAGAYDAIQPRLKELEAENDALKKDVETWKTIALKYRELVKQHEENIQTLLKK